VICDGMRQNLLPKRVPATKVKIFPDYIDPTFIQPIQRASSSDTAGWRLASPIRSEQRNTNLESTFPCA
jgi:hypothetical protein